MAEARIKVFRPALGGDIALELASGTGAYAWDTVNDRLSWSPGLLRIFGLTRAPAAESDFARLVHPDDRTRVEAETSRFLGPGVTSYDHSFRIVRPDGAVVAIGKGAGSRSAEAQRNEAVVGRGCAAAQQVFLTRHQLRQILALAVPLMAYVALIAWLGIYVASGAFIAYFMLRHGQHHRGTVAAVALGVPLAFFLMFERWFKLPLPKGPLEALLGFA